MNPPPETVTVYRVEYASDDPRGCHTFADGKTYTLDYELAQAVALQTGGTPAPVVRLKEDVESDVA